MDAIEPSRRYIAVSDNGFGMDSQAISESYLIIGKPKRPRHHEADKSPGGRTLMGRKGIGKLAPFGIANTIDVITIYQKDRNRRVNWFTLDLPDILRQQELSAESDIRYRAKRIYKDQLIEAIDVDKDRTGSVDRFLSRSKKSAGTLVLLTNLTIKRAIPLPNLSQSMGRRFTVTLLRDDFNLYVNEQALTEESALPKFVFRIPDKARFSTENVGDKEVRYWCGFVETADWPADQAGIGVYAHGKIAQDRPFSFGVRGREVFARYMYGVVEADWLDELGEDLISTDRTSIDWDNENTDALYEWGAIKVRSWIAAYEKFRKDMERNRNKQRILKQLSEKKIPKLTDTEQDSIAELLTEITPALEPNEETLSQITSAFAQAWLHRPMRKLLRTLWDQLSTQLGSPEQTFVSFLTELNHTYVPESLSLAVTFAQRAYAIGLLYDMIHKKSEPDLQKLIETFPWILHPKMELLAANQTLKKVVTEAESEGLIPLRSRGAGSKKNDKERPDFVFFSEGEESQIVVVEIKTPRAELTIENREQLHDYMTYLEQVRGDAKLSGELIGNSPGNRLVSKRPDMQIRTWEQVLVESRYGHVQLLSAMLHGARPDPDDARVSDVHEFGGEATWNLLKQLSSKDPILQELFVKFGR
jgi:Holliday junction resolvase